MLIFKFVGASKSLSQRLNSLFNCGAENVCFPSGRFTSYPPVLPARQIPTAALVTSLFGAYTELISRNGDDTVTVPVVNAIVMLAIHFMM